MSRFAPPFGAFQVQATISDRDSISISSRFEGMSVFVQEAGSTYRLLGGTTDGYWTTIDYSTAEDILYVDIVNGNDGYRGISSEPLKTIQEALYRFIPPGQPAPNFESDVVKEIVVVYTPGMPSVLEYVVKPIHKGGGIIYIRAEHRVEESVTQSGAIALETDHRGLRRIDFTTSPLTANTLADGYFITTVDPVASSADAAFVHVEMSAITDNGDGYVLAPFVNPGASDAFGFFNGASLEIVQPQIEWDAPPTADFGTQPPLITNQGGALMIQGFIFNRSEGFPQNRQTIILDQGQIALFTGGANTTLTMCDFRNMTRLGDTSNSFMISSSYVDLGTSAIFIDQVKLLEMERCHITGPVGELQVKYCNNFQMKGCYITRTAGATNKIQVVGCQNFDITNSDFRNEVNLRVARSNGLVGVSTFEDMGNNAIIITENSYCIVSTVEGSSGNTSHGIEVSRQSSVRSLGTNTLTGSSGDVRVGSITGLAYGDLPVTDATELSRAE